jgi:hypothetical protein
MWAMEFKQVNLGDSVGLNITICFRFETVKRSLMAHSKRFLCLESPERKDYLPTDSCV